MMKLSHESKLRLGVGIGAFVLIIGLVFGISRTIDSFRWPVRYDRYYIWHLSDLDDMVDDDDFLTMTVTIPLGLNSFRVHL